MKSKTTLLTMEQNLTFNELATEVLKHPNCQIETQDVIVFDVHHYVNRAVDHVNGVVLNGKNPKHDQRSKVYKRNLVQLLECLRSNTGKFSKKLGVLKIS